MSTTLSLRLPNETKEQIEDLAKVSRRRKSDMLLCWINEKLELELWQIGVVAANPIFFPATDFQ